MTCILIGSGVFVGLLGVAYYGNIHNITYFILVQIVVGVFEVKYLVEHVTSVAMSHFSEWVY